MNLTAELLAERLESLGAVPKKRLIVAFSGGLDSSVLLHLLSTMDSDADLVAVHINHGLHPAADSWQAHCESVCQALRIRFIARSVDVDASNGLGVEAAAREARYSAFRAMVEPGDCLLSAHHRDDQAETLLLNLMRSSGPLGLSAILPVREFGAGHLCRPLLGESRETLLEYARQHELSWVEDPSNLDTEFDRNFLRQMVLPTFEARWPDVASRLSRSSKLMAEASDLLDALAAIDLEQGGGQAERLSVDALQALDDARRRNLLRYCMRSVGLSFPGRKRLATINDCVLEAKPDASPLVEWPGGEARRYRGYLYLMPAQPETPESSISIPGDADHVPAGPGLGTLRFTHSDGPGISPELLRNGLEIRFRQGGESLQTGDMTRRLKKLLQDAGVVPWMRDRIPLLYSGERLVAVADLWMDQSGVEQPGVEIRWDNHPALY